MTLCQAITIDFDQEMQNTRKLLERVPIEAHENYRPHEKSMPLARLATHIAELPSWLKMALDQDVFNLQPGSKQAVASSTQELLALFDRHVEETRVRLASATDEEMRRTWSFQFGGRTMFSDEKTRVLRSFLNHLVHHRAQLGVYLRLNNIPIPGLYGPSADDTFAAAQ